MGNFVDTIEDIIKSPDIEYLGYFEEFRIAETSYLLFFKQKDSTKKQMEITFENDYRTGHIITDYPPEIENENEGSVVEVEDINRMEYQEEFNRRMRGRKIYIEYCGIGLYTFRVNFDNGLYVDFFRQGIFIYAAPKIDIKKKGYDYIIKKKHKNNFTLWLQNLSEKGLISKYNESNYYEEYTRLFLKKRSERYENPFPELPFVFSDPEQSPDVPGRFYIYVLDSYLLYVKELCEHFKYFDP